MKRFGYSLQEAYSIPINKKVLIQDNLYPKVG